MKMMHDRLGVHSERASCWESPNIVVAKYKPVQTVSLDVVEKHMISRKTIFDVEEAGCCNHEGRQASVVCTGRAFI